VKEDHLARVLFHNNIPTAIIENLASNKINVIRGVDGAVLD
jgi:hypothetical protein